MFLHVSATFLRSSFALTFSTILCLRSNFLAFFVPFFFKFSFGAITSPSLFPRFQWQNWVASRSFSSNACFISRKAKYVILFFKNSVFRKMILQTCLFANVWSIVYRCMLKNRTFRLHILNWTVEKSKQFCRGDSQIRWLMFHHTWVIIVLLDE